MLLNHLGRSFSDLGQWLKKVFLHPSEGMKTFYLLVLIANLCFFYTWVTHSFTVPLGGDYTLQEMTFIYNGYDDWHEFFRTGSFPTWDRSVFLGIDQVGGNSFYYLFDPFFLMLLIFPRSWLLALQGLSYVPKMVLGGMFFYWYLGSFELSPKTRRLGALCYGFSGWAFVYLWFHFVDSAAFLPLMFLGIEKILKKRDPRVLFVGFLLNGMCNYFFFVVFTIGAFLYAIFRFFQTMKKRTGTENWAVIGMGVFAFVIGVCLGAFTLLPGMVVALNMPRTGTNTWLTNIKAAGSLSEMLSAIFSYSSIGDYHRVTPLVNFLFMTDGCFYSNLLNVNGFDNLAASLYATTPMLLLFFVGFLRAFKEKRVSYLIGLALTLLLIFSPVGFYLFSGFTVAYARYFLVPLSWMIVFDCLTVEKRRDIPKNYLDLSAVIVLFLYIVSDILVIYYENSSNSYWDTKMIEIVLSVGWLFICYLVMRPLFHKKAFSKSMFVLSAVDIIIMANVTITFQGTADISTMAGGPSNIAEEQKVVSLLKSSENNEDYYRIFNPTADRGDININLREGYTGLGAFHSVYAFGAQDFLVRSRIPYGRPDDWSMGIHNRRENLETFLGTKYYLVPKVMSTTATGKIEDYDIPYGYVNILNLSDSDKKALGVDYSSDLLDYLASASCDKALYVNQNFVDFAFAYDTVINSEWLNTSPDYTGNYEGYYCWNLYEDINEYPLLRYAMLDDTDYQSFAADNLYNAGTFTANGVTTKIGSTNASTNRYNFTHALVTTGSYVKGASAPIQYVGGKSNLKVTVYNNEWPSTSANPGGEYQQWTSDFYNADGTLNDSKVTAWVTAHPFEAANDLWPGDDKYDYDTLKDDSGKTSSAYTRSLLYHSKIVITPIDSAGNETTVCTEATSGDSASGCYVSIRNAASTDYFTDPVGEDNNNADIRWSLYDADGNLISRAKPSYDQYKIAHGYYTDRPVAKIVGLINYGTKDSPVDVGRPALYIQRDSDYQSAVDSLKANAVTIVSRTDNTVDFKTSYSSNKFVVLNYPKQNGWTLYRKSADATKKSGYTLSEVTQYKAQGGFIGFEAESGTAEYVLNYKSPYFALGAAVTAFGAIVMLITMTVMSYQGRFEHGLEEVNSLHYSADKKVMEGIYHYDDCL